MATLNALRKATIMQDDGTALLGAEATVTTSDATVVALSKVGSTAQWTATGVKGGTATLTAVRTLDGAQATLDVEVIAAAPFAISLGAESPA